MAWAVQTSHGMGRRNSPWQGRTRIWSPILGLPKSGILTLGTSHGKGGCAQVPMARAVPLWEFPNREPPMARAVQAGTEVPLPRASRNSHAIVVWKCPWQGRLEPPMPWGCQEVPMGTLTPKEPSESDSDKYFGKLASRPFRGFSRRITVQSPILRYSDPPERRAQRQPGALRQLAGAHLG